MENYMEGMGTLNTKILPAQVETHSIKMIDIDPDRGEREESAEFRKIKERLLEDGHYHCYICGSTENIQIHHNAVEYKYRNIVDFDKMKSYCEEHDIYGYGKLLKNKPITSVDDIRQMMALCQPHHTGVNHEDGNGAVGVHFLPQPEWIMQKLCLPNCNPIPQKGETIEQALNRIKENERKEVIT